MDSLEEDESDEDLLGESEEAPAGGQSKLPTDGEEGSNPADSAQGASKGYTPLSIKPDANDKETPAKPSSKKSTYPGKKTKSRDGAPGDTSNAAIGAEGDINQPSDVDQSPPKTQEKVASTGSSSGKEDTGNPKEKSAKKKQAVKKPKEKPSVPSDKGPNDHKKSGSNDHTAEVEKEDESFNEVGSMEPYSYKKEAGESLEEEESDVDLVEEIPTGASPVPTSPNGGPEEKLPNYDNPSGKGPASGEKKSPNDALEKQTPGTKSPNPTDNSGEKFPVYGKPSMKGSKNESLEGSPQGVPSYGNPSGISPSAGEKNPDDALEKQTPGTKSPNPTDNSEEKADLESESQEYDYEPCNEGEEDCECMDPDGGEYEACEQGEEDCECEPETEECKEGEEGCECQDEELEYEKCEEGEEDCECYDEDVAPPAYKPKSSSSNAQNSAAEIIQLLNKERTNRHKPEIPTSPELNELAEQHASNYASAKQPSSSPSDWHGENKCNGATEECMESKLRSFGKYTGKGYEIAYKSTSSDPSAIVKGIMKNREYKREILSRKKWKSKPWSHIGAANKGDYTWIWFGVQDSKATPHVSGKTNDSSD
ncbi:hypothetical protein DSO57_1019683 [Entomophthora muscae]|uniref:Uncharacterized protein n=1 Tax=Entomophthora muscae TaxID=34485 RepID=A0ACC2S5Y8_9FUNG|nr:hypothetical protein DSO57_1019683 [Entomophthora muscae]